MTSVPGTLHTPQRLALSTPRKILLLFPHTTEKEIETQKDQTPAGGLTSSKGQDLDQSDQLARAAYMPTTDGSLKTRLKLEEVLIHGPEYHPDGSSPVFLLGLLLAEAPSPPF